MNLDLLYGDAFKGFSPKSSAITTKRINKPKKEKSNRTSVGRSSETAKAHRG
eukprot:TRINITY_DN5032_c0_g1_i1.p2 TRINITY_DN5032_c0_g1~~TRINITY_DN5032_c0_g1_i1.p2  ORF type:complete len:52 (+),score=24.02 TRINITY_DN5032_c0_g1_i1:386-541(+)